MNFIYMKDQWNLWKVEQIKEYKEAIKEVDRYNDRARYHNKIYPHEKKMEKQSRLMLNTSFEKYIELLNTFKYF